MQLGDWKDTGSLKVQDQPPLLLKSTIPCTYGSVSIKITDCGQVNEPDSINGKKQFVIIDAVWMDASMEKEIKKANKGDKVSLLVHVHNFEEEQAISLEIERVNDNGEVEEEIKLTGNVNGEGVAELREKITVGEMEESQ